MSLQYAISLASSFRGGILTGVAEEHPNKELLVLCGHSHYFADIQPLPNLRILTGHSDYGDPQIQAIVNV